jgi:hypothetical protein
MSVSAAYEDTILRHRGAQHAWLQHTANFRFTVSDLLKIMLLERMCIAVRDFPCHEQGHVCCFARAVASPTCTGSSRDSIIRQYFRNKNIARLLRKYCKNIVRLSKKLEILLRDNIAPGCSIVGILPHTAIIV